MNKALNATNNRCTQEEHDAIVADDERWLTLMTRAGRMVLGDEELEAATCPRCGTTRTRPVDRDAVDLMARVIRTVHRSGLAYLVVLGVRMSVADLRAAPSLAGHALAALAAATVLCPHCGGAGTEKRHRDMDADEAWPPRPATYLVGCRTCASTGRVPR